MSRWPKHKAYPWEMAPFFRLLLPLVAGIICYEYHGKNGLPFFAWAFGLLASCVLLLLNLAYGKTRRSFRWPGAAGVFLFLFTSGYLLSFYNDDAQNPLLLQLPVDKGSTFLVRITDIPSDKGQTWKLPVSLIKSVTNNTSTHCMGKAFIYMRKSEKPMLFKKGDSLLIPGNWQPIANAGNPYEFDYAAYCRRNNIFYRQFCSEQNIRLYAACDPASLPLTGKVHDWCMMQLDQNITDDKTRGLIQAMLLGDEVNLDEDLLQSFTQTGIVHVIAISGSNIMMFFSLFAFLLRWVKHRKYLWVKYLAALPLVWFYVVLSGSSPSAIRAAIMFSILATGITFQKNNNSFNQLLATAFILLCAQPGWLFSLGFQLSFVAVLSLVFFYNPLHKLWSPSGKLVKGIWATMVASFAAEILVAPLVVFYFHNFPLLFLVSNVAAYAFMGIVLILGICIIVCSGVLFIPHFLGLVTTGLVTLFDYLLQWFRTANPASFYYLKLTGWELLFLYLAIGGGSFFIMRKNKKALFLSLVSCCVVMALLNVDKWKSLNQQRFVVFNTPHNNRIEVINGDGYSVISTDTTGAKKISYIVNPSHIQWQAWQQSGSGTNEILRIGGKTILILNKEMTDGGHFPVDYVVINYNGAADINSLKKIFTPETIIIGNNYTSAEQEQWVTEGAALHVHVHSIHKDGAFLISND